MKTRPWILTMWMGWWAATNPMPTWAQRPAAEPLPPPSTLLVIEDHAERFFDLADAAFQRLQAIGERDTFWEQADQAAAFATAHPDDEAAQQAFRQAKASYLADRVPKMIGAQETKEATLKAHENFERHVQAGLEAARNALQSSVEITKARKQAYDHTVDRLVDIRDLLQRDVEFTAEETELLHLAKAQLDKIRDDLRLAQDSQSLAEREISIWLGYQARALSDVAALKLAYVRLPNDIDTFAQMARNELRYIELRQREQRLAVAKSRPAFDMGTGALPWAAGERRYAPLPESPEDLSRQRQAQALAFLKNLPDRSSVVVDAGTDRAASPMPPLSQVVERKKAQ